MLDFCATHDRRRLDRAVSSWLRSIDSPSLLAKRLHNMFKTKAEREGPDLAIES